MEPYGIIDIGSNTVVVVIYESIDPIRIAVYEAEPVRLISYNRGGVMQEEGIEKTLQVLKRYRSILEDHHVAKTFAFITEPWRHLSNTGYFLSRLAESGFEIDPLSGTSEASYDFYGSRIDCGDIPTGNAVDIGGGSTELISFQDNAIHAVYSLPAGAVRLKELPVEDAVPARLIQDAFAACPSLRDTPGELLIGIGGTARAAGLLAEELFPGQPITIDTIRTMRDHLKEEEETTVAAMKKVIAPGRWAVLLPGLNMLWGVMNAYHAKTLRVSQGCVREGYLLQKLSAPQ
ncbi:MAG: hypothetical protein IKS32_00385 [Solobacterium sp.]|nr:hypothetical protein [Solobacterium sp.]